MPFKLGRALDFNKFTIGLAAAGLAYAGTIGSEAPVGAPGPSSSLKWICTLAILMFGSSILFGTFVNGRATRLAAKDDQMITDPMMQRLGQLHSATLILGLVVAGFLMMNKMWRWL
jgi:hypothetical protein